MHRGSQSDLDLEQQLADDMLSDFAPGEGELRDMGR